MVSSIVSEQQMFSCGCIYVKPISVSIVRKGNKFVETNVLLVDDRETKMPMQLKNINLSPLPTPCNGQLINRLIIVMNKCK